MLLLVSINVCSGGSTVSSYNGGGDSRSRSSCDSNTVCAFLESRFRLKFCFLNHFHFTGLYSFALLHFKLCTGVS